MSLSRVLAHTPAHFQNLIEPLSPIIRIGFCITLCKSFNELSQSCTR